MTEHRFGQFHFQPAEQRLVHRGEPVALTARACALLAMLVQAGNRLVTKEALLDQVWAGRVVEENNLAVQVAVLRRLLGAEAIETVPGKGYRFTPTLLEAPAPAAPAAHPLPLSLFPLLGREDDLAAVRQLLAAHRLVTIVGAGGIGKSRLALAVARAAQDGWRDGVGWIELAGLGDPALVGAAIAQALGIGTLGRSCDVATLAAALAGRQMLLVVDNCEHLIEPVAVLLERLLQGAPGLHVLATSQEPLHLHAEQQYRLEPLAIPRDAGTPGARDYGAVALLESRVRACLPNHRLDEADLALAIDVCRRLDGLPLAIELAAARVPSLGLRTVHDRLDERFRLLTAGSRTALRRHQTLRAAIDWSHGLLDDRQRRTFMRLGVFSGGFTLATAQPLVAGPDEDAWALVDAVAALVDKSLVVLEHGGSGPRYRLLESARAYALEQIVASGEADELRHRHARVMADFLRRVDDANLDGQLRTDEYAAQVLPELDNLRAAMAWAAGPTGDPEIAFALAAHVSPLIDYSLEFVDWMLGQRAQVQPAAVDVTTARFLRGLAASNMYGYLPVRAQLEAALGAAQRYRDLGLARRHFSALRRAFVWATNSGDLEQARGIMRESEALVRPDWDIESRIEVLRSRSHLAGIEGDLESAIRLRREAVRIARDIGRDWRLEVMEETCVAALTWCAGRPREALALLTRLIEAMDQRPASDYELLDAVETRLWILSDLGDLQVARAALVQALPILRRMPRFNLAGCAHLLVRFGHHEQAATVLAAHATRAREGLAQHLPPDMPTLHRLHREAVVAVEAALPAERLAAIGLGEPAPRLAAICELLAQAVDGG